MSGFDPETIVMIERSSNEGTSLTRTVQYWNSAVYISLQRFSGSLALMNMATNPDMSEFAMNTFTGGRYWHDAGGIYFRIHFIIFSVLAWS